VGPHPGVAIGLKLQSNRQLVGEIGAGGPCPAHLGLGAEQVLHVVPDFVRQNVGLGEVSGRSEAPLQLLVEPEVDVDLLVRGTVERSGGRLGESARGLHRVPEEHQLGRPV
jgi:hypothetical protein